MLLTLAIIQLETLPFRMLNYDVSKLCMFKSWFKYWPVNLLYIMQSPREIDSDIMTKSL